MRRHRVAERARGEIQSALKTSSRNFGPRARRDYKALINRAVALLCEDPKRPGVQQREGMQENVFLFHLRNARTRGQAPKQARHFIVFTFDDASLTILRVLHDSMDVEQHMGEQTEDS
jgi:toxin ParE1/3/4